MIYLTIVDTILILFLLCGAVLGFKKGAIKSLVALIGTFLIVIIAYYLKNHVAEVLFKFVPFFNFGGAWTGLVTLNILLYEAISYLLVFIVLYSVLNIFLKVSGIIEKILTFTIILGIPSKIIGAVLGFLEALVFSFIILFALLQFNATHKFVNDSSLAMNILDKTPIIGGMVDDTYLAIKEIETLTDKYDNNSDKDAYNQDILSILLKYQVVKPDTAENLVKKDKLKFKGADNIIREFKEKENKND